MNARTDEDLIRQALERQAQYAVTADRIRAALPARLAGRTRARRVRNGALFVAAAVAVAGVITVPILTLGRDAAPGTTGAQPGAAPPVAAAPSATQLDRLSLRYRPTWVPKGFTERSRLISGEGGQFVSQIWLKGPRTGGFYTGGPRLEVSVQSAQNGVDPLGKSGTRLRIGGHDAYLVGDPTTGEKTYLHWMVDPSTVLQVFQVDYRLSQETLVRVAESVRPTRSTQVTPIRPGWLPEGMVATPGAEISGDSEKSWLATTSAQGPALQPASPSSPTDDKAELERRLKEQKRGYEAPSVRLTVGTGSDAPAGGEEIILGGRPARFVTVPAGAGTPTSVAYVVVERGNGILLTASSKTPSLSHEDLLRIADRADVDPSPDLAWLATT